MPGTPRFRMPAFSMRDLGQRVAEILLVVVVDRGDDSDRGLRDHIGGIEPAAQTDFEQQIVGGRAAKARKAAAVVISKKVIGSPRIGRFAFLEQRAELVFGDEFAAAGRSRCARGT